MDSEKREQLTLQEAENFIKQNDFQVACNSAVIAAALTKVITAMKAENYQLIRLDLMLEKIDEVAKRSLKLGDDAAAVYIACLEDVANIIKDCL